MKYYAELLRNIHCVNIVIENGPEVLETDGKNKLVGDDVVIWLPAEVAPGKVHVHNGRVRLAVAATEIPGVTQKKFEPPKCRCGELITETVRWKQLPSEHWAELMDLWHCHKPNETQPTNDSLYALASTGFQPQPGLAFYSDTHFLVHPDDIRNHKECVWRNKKKIWKWDLQRTVAPSFAAMLNELVDSHAVFTYKVNDSLLLWVLNTNAVYSTGGPPCTATKVFYGPISLEHMRPDLNTVDLPSEVYQRLVTEMETCNARLPTSAQRMGEWALAFLDH